MIGNIKDKINAYLGRDYVKFIKLTLDRKSVPTKEESDRAIKQFLSD